MPPLSLEPGILSLIENAHSADTKYVNVSSLFYEQVDEPLQDLQPKETGVSMILFVLCTRLSMLSTKGVALPGKVIFMDHNADIIELVLWSNTFSTNPSKGRQLVNQLVASFEVLRTYSITNIDTADARTE